MESLLHQIREPSVWVPALIFGSTLAVLYSYYFNYYNYWPSRGLKGARPFFIIGELYELFFADRMKRLIGAPKKYGKLYGSFSFGRPRLVVADPEVIRQICIKDFDAFTNHNLNSYANKFQRRFLVWLQDDEWKRLRSFLTPIFTSGKIKRMYKLLNGCSEDLVDNFKEQYIMARRAGLQAAEVDLFKTYSMYTMDGITSCCYSLHLAREKASAKGKRGLSRNSLVDDVNQIFSFSVLRMLPIALLPKFLLKAIDYQMQRESRWQGLVKRLEHLIRQRRTGVKAFNDDLMSMMLEAKSDDVVELNESDQAENHHAGLTEELLKQDQEKLKAGVGSRTKVNLSDFDVLATSIFMLSAGLDTTRSSLSTITYFLAHNQDVQEKLFQEIKKIAKFEETAMDKRLLFDYDDLTSCQYLDAVISESLRMMPPAPATDRLVGRDYLIEKYGYRLAKGSQLILNISAVQNDPDYWHEPGKFNPERFMPGEREKIVPGSYLPFSIGPRHCIGMRFSLTETKLGLAKVVMNFKFEPAPGTDYPPAAKLGLGLISVKDCRVRVTLRDID